MAPASRAIRIGLAALAAACSGGPAGTFEELRVDGFSPEGADFRHEATVQLRGAGFTDRTEVFFGETAASVVRRQHDLVEVKVPAPGRGVRVAVRAREGDVEALAPGRFAFRGMEADAILLVDAGVVAQGPAGRALVADFDGDDKRDLLVVDGGKTRWLRGTGPFRFEEKGAIDGEALGAGDPVGIGRSFVFLRAGEAVEIAALEDETVVRKPLAGVTKGAAFAAEGAQVALVADGVAGRALIRVEAEGSEFVAREAFPLAAFEAVSVALGDADGDGSVDAILGGVREGPRLLLGDGHGAFRDASPDAFDRSAPGAARFGDVDGDGRLDVVVTGASGDTVFLREGTRYLERTLATLGAAAAALRTTALADLDVDGAIDRVASTGTIALHRNDGEGRFYDYTARAARGVRAFRPIDALDLDDDGDPDLLATDAAGRLHVLENWAPNAIDDPDDDGVPGARDVCPRVADPDQLDSDAFPFSCANEADCAARTGCTLFKPNDDRLWLLCSRPATFSGAAEFCRQRGARLAVPHSNEEARVFGEKLGRAWIGLSDTVEEGQFRDVTGGTPTYTPWKSGEPNDAGGREDCTETDGAGGWNDLPCDQALAFGCEDATTRNPDGSGDACDVCPFVPDPSQDDADEDGVGDVCEAPP